MSAERAAITGIGVVSPIGVGVQAFLESLLAARCGIERVPRLEDTPYRARHAGLVPHFPAPERSAGQDFAALDRHLQLALVAAEQALADAGLDPASLGERIGLVFGTCNGGMLCIERHYRALHGKDPELKLDEALVFSKRYYSGATTLAHRFGIRGPATSVVTACAASGNAVGLGRDWLLEGRVDAVLVGGADAFSDTTLAGFDRLMTTSPERCAPFSEPMGLNLGEGSGFWILERESEARTRGARVHGFTLGYGLSCDAHHATAPDPSGEGLALAIQRALDDAGAELGSVGYINAHGTGTEANDRAESRVLERLFGGDAPPVSSTKSFFGHCLGAAGILEATAALLCLGQDRLPPTLKFVGPRPGCNLDFVPNEAREASATRFLSQNAAFGGNNCALVLATAEDADPGPPSPAVREDPDPVVITGLGLVTAAGAGHQPLARALEQGETLVRPVERFDVQGCTCREAGLVDSLGDSRLERRLGLQGMDRCSRYATAAAHMALDRAGIRLRPRAAKEVGLLVGLTVGPTRGEMEYLKSLFTEGVPNLVHFPFLVLNSVAGNVSRALLLKGFSSTFCSGPGSGLESLVLGESAVRLGHARTLLVCGVDEVTERVQRDLDETGALNGRQGRGRALGEGGAALALESYEQARSRKAAILARVLAARSGFDPDVFREKPRDASRLTAFLEKLLEAGGRAPDQISAVCLGARLPSCAPAEEQALDCLLGAHDPLRLRLDPLIGSALAAAPLISLAHALATVESGTILALATSDCGEHHAVLLHVDADRGTRNPEP